MKCSILWDKISLNPECIISGDDADRPAYLMAEERKFDLRLLWLFLDGWNKVIGLTIILLCLSTLLFRVLFLRRRDAPRDACYTSSHDGEERSGLNQLWPPLGDNHKKESVIDIVAIHGLDTQSPKTWLAYRNGKDETEGVVHWLKDEGMLRDKITNARIFTYNWPANTYQHAPVESLDGHAKTLLSDLHRENLGRRPTIFVASCFGGLLLAKAFTLIPFESFDQAALVRNTMGIVFLGTPFRGAFGVSAAQLRVLVSSVMGGESCSRLLANLTLNNDYLSSLENGFSKYAQQNDIWVYCFYETHKSNIARGALPSWAKDWASKFLKATENVLVPEACACLSHSNKEALHVSHVLLNKFSHPDDQNFRRVLGALVQLTKRLGLVDAAVRKYYDGKLNIERLSGEKLPMDRCFINLAIIDHVGDHKRRTVDSRPTGDPATNHHLSKFSLQSRLKVDTPPVTNQVTLETLFNPRKRTDGTPARPNRILIWGRAGVGKTTLCRKIVHDFYSNGLWRDLYDRVFWLPLRKLKSLQNASNYMDVIQDEYLSEENSNREFLRMLLQQILERHGSQTLFVLDGLDEVSFLWDGDHRRSSILAGLLKRTNLIITSRPHSTDITKHTPCDLELETIGFFPEQVKKYLHCEIGEKQNSEKTVSEIRSFIQSHPLMQSLVRIPIQLDAICYVWDVSYLSEKNVTMTKLYHAVSKKLWEAYIVRRDDLSPQLVKDKPSVEDLVKDEISYWTERAFSGLYNESVELTDQSSMLNDRPIHMPFLRSSDDVSKTHDRTYHFIHLTFQEFFAAKYFVRQWTSDAKIAVSRMDPERRLGDKKVDPIAPMHFLKTEKYNDRYDIFWRFVVGLLHIEEDHDRLKEFFEILEGEPRDLLGPMHQRLTIHCLSEISTVHENFEFRFRELEETYWRWIIFESEINSSTALMQEAECPDRLFMPWLKGSKEEKIRVMSVLANRPVISAAILNQITSELDKHSHEDIFSAAFQVLGNHCSHISGERFFELFANQEERLRLEAVRALARSTILGMPAVSALVRLLRDDDRHVRWNAAIALGGQTALPDTAVAALVGLLRDDDPDVRSNAAIALGGQTALPDTAVAALEGLLRDDEPHVRSTAAIALGGQTALPDTAVAALEGLLRDDDPDVRSYAAIALDGQTALPDTAVAALEGLLRDDDRHVRWNAAIALGGQTALPDTAVAALVGLLRDDDPDVRWNAARALGGQTALPDTAVAALEGLLRDDEPHVRSTAAIALGGQTALPDTAVAALVGLLRDDDPDVRSNAARALDGQTALPDTAVAALVGLLRDDDRHVRSNAARALGGQTALPDTTLPDTAVAALVGLLRDDDPDVRSNAARALGGQTALPDTTLPDTAVAALVGLLRDDDRHVRSSAANVLQNCKDLWSLIPGMGSSLLHNLLSFWLQESFDYSGTCLIWNGAIFINVDGELRSICLEKGQQKAFEDACFEAQAKIGIPPPAHNAKETKSAEMARPGQPSFYSE